MAAYETIHALQGDTLDELLWRETGRGSGLVEAVLDANPGLAGIGPILPDGHAVLLPIAANTAAPPAAIVQLWD